MSKKELKEVVNELVEYMEGRIITEGLAKRIQKVSDLINQMDETEKSTTTNVTKEEMVKKYGMSQDKWNELIERYKWHLEYDGYTVTKKPVVPDFVGEYIKSQQSRGCTLSEAFDDAFEFGDDIKIGRWIFHEDNEDLFARAWLHGFTVEEKKYYVIEPTTGQFLIKDTQQSSGVKWVDGFSSDPESYTEQEIKNIDERYWDFRKPVEEVK